MENLKSKKFLDRTKFFLSKVQYVFVFVTKEKKRKKKEKEGNIKWKKKEKQKAKQGWFKPDFGCCVVVGLLKMYRCWKKRKKTSFEIHQKEQKIEHKWKKESTKSQLKHF